MKSGVVIIARRQILLGVESVAMYGSQRKETMMMINVNASLCGHVTIGAGKHIVTLTDSGMLRISDMRGNPTIPEYDLDELIEKIRKDEHGG